MISASTPRRALRARSLGRLCGLLCCIALLAWGCAKAPLPTVPPRPAPVPPPVVQAPSFEPLPREQALALARRMSPATQGLRSWRDLEPGLKSSLAYVCRKPAGAVAFSRPGLSVTWGAMRQTLEDLLSALPYLDNDPALLAQVFDWYPLEQNTLVTGYYEPYLEASLTPDPQYPYPLYGRPADMLEVDLGEFHPRWRGQVLRYRMQKKGIKPYYSREDIDFTGALRGKGDELAWVKDRVELYFLQIQGSGRLILPDGEVKHVLYADKNGRELNMLGRTIIKRGYLKPSEASMPRIREFVREHPDLTKSLLSADKSYVFFKLADTGPFGSMGKLLTPMASVAVDRSRVPLGAALAMSVPLPTPQSGGPANLSGLVMAQDTGGAIVGNHVDLFCGSGPYAEYVSGRMKNPGALNLLVSRRALEPAQDSNPSEPAAEPGKVLSGASR